MMKGLVSSLSLLAIGATAQQSPYGQCGGTGYSGPTSCTSGYTCTVENDYYSQCVPGTASASVTSTTSVVKTTSSASSVDPSHPLELRAGPDALGGSLGGEKAKGKSSGDQVSSASSSETAVVTLSTAIRSASATSSKTSSSTPSTTSTSAASTGTSTGSFATTDGLLFNIDGESKYYAGTNCYWCGFLTEDEDVDSVFSHMADGKYSPLSVALCPQLLDCAPPDSNT